MKKLGVMLLALLLCVSMLTSCNQILGGWFTSATEETTTTPGGDDPDAPRVSPNQLKIVENGKTEYRIVYSLSKTEWEYDMAKNLQTAIKRLTGVTVPMIDDLEFDEETARQEKEILIGYTNRDEDYDVDAAYTPYGLGYVMYVNYERMVILGNSQAGMYEALRTFVKDHFGYDLNNYQKNVNNLPKATGKALGVAQAYLKTERINSQYLPGMDVMLEDLVIVHDGTSLYKRVAYEVRNYIGQATGIYLVIKDEPQTDRTPTITFRSNATLEKGTWKVAVEENTITVMANGYYGFYAAAKYFESEIRSNGYYPFEAEQAQTGDYLSDAVDKMVSNKYAYDKQGENRVMFLNVLFNEQATSGSGANKVTLKVPTTPRNELQAMMIAEYLPDVLGCQEFNKTKRGYQNDGAGGLSGLLRKMGYVEAVDPRVKNAYSAGEYIPGTDASLTNDYTGLIKGYGTSGATWVTYGGESFYTYYNNTPIFYNPQTTDCLRAEYYWYKSQWDKITGATHDNGSSDCGSKSATWGVFMNKKTGDKYIVISTHMCTRSDYVRELQAAELITLANWLIDTYNCPIFFGGDMNGNLGDSNYDMFVTKADAKYQSKYDVVNTEYAGGGFTSLQDDRIATDFTSNLKTNRNYPNYDDTKEMMTPGSSGVEGVTTIQAGENKNSIDQIFVKNHSKVDIKIFGIVVDDIVLSSSDHLPIFTDFTIN